MVLVVIGRAQAFRLNAMHMLDFFIISTSDMLTTRYTSDVIVDA